MTRGQRARLTFDIPGQEAAGGRSERRRGPGAGDVTREWHGATYAIEQWSEGRHDGDPQQLALREPSGYEHPRWLGPVELGQRMLPVSQKISHGPQPSREGEFTHGQDDPDIESDLRQGAHDLLKYHAANGFNDRRVEGRRYRPTDFIDDLMGPQEPYRIEGRQADVDPRRYFTN